MKDPAKPASWEAEEYERALDEAAARQRLLNSPEYEAAYTAIRNFQNDHGGKDSLQYADDFLIGNMTVEEYKMVDPARKFLMGFWRDTTRLYKRCKLASDTGRDFFAPKSRWLLQGGQFRALVEPLDIANWYKAGNTESSGHYFDAIGEGDDGQRPGAYTTLERLERERLAEGASLKDSVAKAEEYKRLFLEGKLEVQSVGDARAVPPRGFKKQSAAAASATATPASTSIGTPNTWKYEVFISHAGEDKPFGEALHRDLNGLGLTAFLDKVELLPGGAADEAMLDAANKAPVGIAVFSPEYFAKKWPMRELEILVKRQVMLPVVFRFDSHEKFVESLRSSTQQALVQGDWETFTKTVERTTYLKRQEDYTGSLQQALCFNVVRMLAENVCPKLPGSVRTGDILDRVAAAAERLQNEDLYPDLKAKQLRTVRECADIVKTRKKQLIAMNA